MSQIPFRPRGWTIADELEADSVSADLAFVLEQLTRFDLDLEDCVCILSMGVRSRDPAIRAEELRTIARATKWLRRRFALVAAWQ